MPLNSVNGPFGDKGLHRQSGSVPEVGVLILAPSTGQHGPSRCISSCKCALWGQHLPPSPLPCAHYIQSYPPSPRPSLALSKCSIKTTKQFPVSLSSLSGAQIQQNRRLSEVFPIVTVSFIRHSTVWGHSFGAFSVWPNQAHAQIKTCQGNKPPTRTKGAAAGTVTVMATFFCGANGH